MRHASIALVLALALYECKSAQHSITASNASEDFEVKPDAWKQAVGSYTLNYPETGPESLTVKHMLSQPIQTYSAALEASGLITIKVKFYDNWSAKTYQFKINNNAQDDSKTWISWKSDSKTGYIGYSRVKASISNDDWLFRDYPPSNADEDLARLLDCTAAIAAAYPEAKYIDVISRLKAQHIQLLRQAYAIMNGEDRSKGEVVHGPAVSLIHSGSNAYDDWTIFQVILLNKGRLPEFSDDVIIYTVKLEADHNLLVGVASRQLQGQATFDLGVTDPYFKPNADINKFAVAARVLKRMLFGNDEKDTTFQVGERINFKEGLETLFDLSSSVTLRPSPMKDFLFLVEGSILASLAKDDIEKAPPLDLAKGDPGTNADPSKQGNGPDAPDQVDSNAQDSGPRPEDARRSSDAKSGNAR